MSQDILLRLQYVWKTGIPIETLSKILGHTNLRVTQAYAKITHKKVMNDMQALKDRLEY